MEISIPGLKINLVTLFVIVVLFWIMMGHLLCSTYNVVPADGRSIFKSTASNFMEGFRSATRPRPRKPKEEFTTMKDAQFAKANDVPVDTSSWFTPNLSYTKTTDLKKDKPIQDILNRPAQPIPLPEGELDFFATTEFKPECCPNAYSNSTGCACMTTKQYSYLIERGSNNVPYSEY
jgi:hypothetical protein